MVSIRSKSRTSTASQASAGHPAQNTRGKSVVARPATIPRERDPEMRRKAISTNHHGRGAILDGVSIASARRKASRNSSWCNVAHSTTIPLARAGRSPSMKAKVWLFGRICGRSLAILGGPALHYPQGFAVFRGVMDSCLLWLR